MKKTVLGVMVLVFLLVLALPTAALADGPGNSDPGDDRYTETAAHANDNAQCGTGASSGAFGYLGKDLNPGQETWNGGNGTKPGTTHQTGINNSSVCGNR